MPITNREKLNLERFGCTFRESTGVFLIDWKGKRAAQASTANIFAYLGHVKTDTGPVVLLAIEISSVRPLPNYCYFPFDLKRKGHKKYLSHFVETGEIRLLFLTDKGTCKRTHRLTPYLRSRVSEIYKELLRECEAIEGDRYDFESALQLMESHVRVPEFLERFLLEDDLREISQKIAQAIHAVPNENRELARCSVREATEAFLPYYRNNRKNFLEILFLGRRGFTYAIDLHRFFADKPEGVTEFLSDALAATFSLKELERLLELVKFVVSLSKLAFEEQSPPTTESILSIPELPTGLTAQIQSMAESGISKDAASRFLQLIGLEVGGRPGRPPKDYSREYALKEAGRSWRAVAEHTLENDHETREEFGGRKYQALAFEEKETLKHRIREGVRSYAKRIGKPFPPAKSKEMMPPYRDVGQENSD